MNTLLRRLSISQKLAVICLSFSLPIFVMLYLLADGINANIRFARLELAGNDYLRSLEPLLELIPQHQALARRLLAGESAARTELVARQAEIDRAFGKLLETDARLGADLQFTAEGLAKRQPNARAPPRCNSPGPPCAAASSNSSPTPATSATLRSSPMCAR